MITSLFFLTLSMVNAAENAYQPLAITLEANLMSHISAIYQNDLYVFGGRNASTGTWNSKFWKLPLLDKFTLAGVNDITLNGLDQSDWVELIVNAPAYGDSDAFGGENEFVCEGQCSVVIDNYLYIVGPYSSTTSTQNTFAPDWIYRLDLSQNPPVFSQEAAFSSTTNYLTRARYPCVTAVNDTMYTISGIKDNVFSDESVAYDTSTDSQTRIAELTAGIGRFYAACAPNRETSEIYLVGGTGTAKSTGVQGVDTYDIVGNTWTDNSGIVNFETGLSQSRTRTKCFTSPYKNTLECVGGRRGAVVDSNEGSIIWDYETHADQEYVNVPTAVISPGVNTYEFVNNGFGSDAATIVLVTGGADVDADAVNTIQYAVRYTLLTSEPTAAPIKSPTKAPSKSPVVPPTPAPLPSKSPSKSPTGFPSGSPTTDPTTDPVPGPTARPTTATPTHNPTVARNFGDQLADAFGGNPDCHDTWVACNSLVFVLLLLVIIAFIVYWILGGVWFKRRQDNRPLPPSMNPAQNVEMGGGGKAAHTTANKWKSAWELEQEAKQNAASGGMHSGPVGDVGGGW